MIKHELKIEQIAVINYGQSGMKPGPYLDKYMGDDYVWIDNGNFVNIYRIVK